VWGHKTLPILECSDDRWELFSCSRCGQGLCQITVKGALELDAQNLRQEQALMRAVGRGLANELRQTMREVLDETFSEAIQTPVEIPVRKLVIGHD
jgi:hypothetical protein